MADGFDVVPIGADNESAVVIGMVPRADTGRAITRVKVGYGQPDVIDYHG